MSHQKIAAKFDEWARNGRDEGMAEGHGDVVRQVIEQMSVQPGERILDLGCGNGWATRLLAQTAPGANAVGVDCSPEMIARAEEIHVLTIRARYEQRPFEDLGFKDGRFHHVFSMEALYYSPDLDRALAEMYRVLAAGGTADVIVDRYAERADSADWHEKVNLDMHFLSEAEWRAAFEKAGFERVESKRVVDSRGPGDEATFEPSEHYPDWGTRVAAHEAGSLWIHATKGQ